MTLCKLHNGAQCKCNHAAFCVYEEEDALQKAVRNTCRWISDADEGWHSECGECFVFNDGTPTENQMRFCPYCGKPMQQLPLSSSHRAENNEQERQ